MKSMTCKELGGACELIFTAETFEEMAELSKQHGKDMYIKQDAAHLEAMSAMQELMKEPEALKNGSWTKELPSTLSHLINKPSHIIPIKRQ